MEPFFYLDDVDHDLIARRRTDRQRLGFAVQLGTAQAMLPRVDLPELLLEVHAWTGFLDAYTHLAEAATRTKDLAVSVAALLIAEACNVGLTPVIKPGEAALTRARLAHVDQYYVSAPCRLN